MAQAATAESDSQDPALAGHLGRVYLPTTGAAVGSYDFLVDPEAVGARLVEVGTPVTADTIEGAVIGTVVDLKTFGRDNDPMQVDYSNDPSLPPIPSENRHSVIMATVQVFWSPAIRPVQAGVVRPATAVEMAKATGADRIDWPIPAGAVSLLGGGYARVDYDGYNLLGPTGAHCMLGGISGQAAKTSYAGILLKGALSAGSEEKDSVAALVFNVKGDDLLYLDEPPAPGYELTDEDRALYNALGIDPTPFPDVLVYAPSLPGGKAVRTSRAGTTPLRWDLAMVWPYLRYLINVYEDEKVASFLADFRESLLNHHTSAQRIDTFAKLDAWFAEHLQVSEDEEPRPWKTHHPATMRRIWRMLSNLVPRCGGLLSKETASDADDVQDKNWHHGQVVVVDIAGLHTEVQALVIARTAERLMRSAERGELGVDHLMVFADELNNFAPSSGAEMSAIRKILQRLSTQGRYAGISLIGAAQLLSKVDELTRTNAGTRAIGVTSETELSSGVYGRLPRGLSERLATLRRGEMAVWHYTMRSTLVVRFPRPAWRTGAPKGTGKARRKTSIDVLGLSARSAARLTEGVPAQVADDIIASADDPTTARERLAKARVPDMRTVAVATAATADPDDPFAIGD